MGTEYYIVNHSRKAGFEAGKYWGEFDLGAISKGQAALVLAIEELYDSIYHDDTVNIDYFNEIARRILIFVGDTPPEQLELAHEEDWHKYEDKGYTTTCGRYMSEKYSDLQVRTT